MDSCWQKRWNYYTILWCFRTKASHGQMPSKVASRRSTFALSKSQQYHTYPGYKKIHLFPRVSLYPKICEIIQTKIVTRVYEPSNSSYQSCWFGIKKKNGKTRIVHSLELLNKVMIQHSGITPIPDHLIQKFCMSCVWCDARSLCWLWWAPTPWRFERPYYIPNAFWNPSSHYTAHGMGKLSTDIPRQCYLCISYAPKYQSTPFLTLMMYQSKDCQRAIYVLQRSLSSGISVAMKGILSRKSG